MVTKKEEIINATFQLFAEKGYNTSMSDIAKQVQIKVPSIYSHFQNKDEIIYITVHKEIENYFGALFKEIETYKQEGCEKQLKGICFSILTYFKDIQKNRFWYNIGLIYNEELRTKCSNLIKKKEIKFSRIITEIINRGIQQNIIRDENLEGTAYLYLEMIQGILNTLLMHHDTELDTDNFIEKTWQAYWSGIRV